MKKHNNFLILVVSLLFSNLHAFGSENLILKKVFSASEINYYLDQSDVYYNFGEFSGLKVDQHAKKPVEFIPELETLTHYYVKNMYNQKNFWIAEIPKNSVYKVFYQLALFSAVPNSILSSYQLAHGQLRFELSEPVTLYRVNTYGQVVTTQTDDLIFTIQAALPEGAKYNFFNAYKGDYLLVARLINSYDRMKYEEIDDGDIMTQYKLINFSPKEMNQLLLNSISYSSEILLSKRYHGSTANCINELMDIIDSTKNIVGKFDRLNLTLENMSGNGMSPNEKMTVEALQLRRFINPNGSMTDTNFRQVIKLKSELSAKKLAFGSK